MRWEAQFEAEATEQLGKVCEPGRPQAERQRAWQRLLAMLAPHIEGRARSSRLLRRCRLDGEDDVRAVLVAVLERLRAGDHANLRAFLERRAPDRVAAAEPDSSPAPATLDPRIEALSRVARLAVVDEEEEPRALPAARPATPLRAWIFGLCDFVIHDHVRARLGWASTERVLCRLADRASATPAALAAAGALRGVVAIEHDADEGTLLVEFQPGLLRIEALAEALGAAGLPLAGPPDAGPGRRGVHTDAERLDGPSAPEEPSARPPITDYLTLSRVMAAISDHAQGFPEPMQRALSLWMADASFEEIARALGEPDPQRARALVRAAHARLRERFRGEWPELFGG